MFDPATLESVLSSLDVRLGDTQQRSLSAGARLGVDRGVLTLVYVVAGEITGDASTETACAVDVAEGAASLCATRTLLAGDAFLSFGRREVTLTSTSGARLMTAQVQVTSLDAVRSLPGVIFVTGFARLEPAAAALAAQLGPGHGDATRAGDPMICRLMVSTVLLSVIRAWADHDTASRLPLTTGDDYLDRVAAAVRDDPGRLWTVDALATIGAMSRTVLSERFRAAFGRSPASYVTEVRMRRAQELLQAGRSVSETSRALGYASDEGFSRAFRRHVGVVPSSWRAGRRGGVAV
ncbi:MULTISPECIES: helix-turn-helix transcriptional regulator [unclassified Microbacterium]|uniref:helix-turn-helix transcriptional regulator n=1 Tax=unclassified Microbacterium TaxID=2609290 RepID=UPI000D58225A|nr:AraC family transcriptional regulator [Microbacterium sp. Gd 4-13]PVW04702.1 AraC family transcriptional regulator [Microbacterium sp. Gd 4-13]